MTRKHLELLELLEISLATAIAIIRLFTTQTSQMWRDWILIVCGYWIFTVLKSRSPAWPVATITVMSYLLGIYILGQLPHALAVLGVGV